MSGTHDAQKSLTKDTQNIPPPPKNKKKVTLDKGQNYVHDDQIARETYGLPSTTTTKDNNVTEQPLNTTTNDDTDKEPVSAFKTSDKNLQQNFDSLQQTFQENLSKISSTVTQENKIPSSEDKGKSREDDHLSNLSNQNQTPICPSHNNDTLPDSDNEFADHSGVIMHELFTVLPVSAFRYKSLLHNSFKELFHNLDKTIKVIGPKEFNGSFYFIFRFYDEQLYQKYTNFMLEIYDTKFLLKILTNDNIERETMSETIARARKTIKITNIPYFISNGIIESCITKQLGKFNFIQEYTINRRKQNNTYNQSQQRLTRPNYQQFLITLVNEDTVRDIFN